MCQHQPNVCYVETFNLKKRHFKSDKFLFQKSLNFNINSDNSDNFMQFSLLTGSGKGILLNINTFKYDMGKLQLDRMQHIHQFRKHQYSKG